MILPTQDAIIMQEHTGKVGSLFGLLREWVLVWRLRRLRRKLGCRHCDYTGWVSGETWIGSKGHRWLNYCPRCRSAERAAALTALAEIDAEEIASSLPETGK